MNTPPDVTAAIHADLERSDDEGSPWWFAVPPEAELLACPICRAVVPRRFRDDHQEWHDR